MNRLKRIGRRGPLVLAGLIVLLSATGCEYTSTPSELLINPRLTPENAELASAVQDALPPRSKLSLPDRSDTTSAVSKIDLDGDGEMEAVVTFAGENDKHQVMALKKRANGWKPWFTFAESSVYGIDFMRTEDMDGDGVPEVLIGWNEYGEPEHMLDIYHVPKDASADSVPRPIGELPYEIMNTGDVNGDGHDELALVNLNRDNLKAAVTIESVTGSTVRKLASAPLNGSVNGYTQLAAGKIAPARYGLLTYAGIGAHSTSASMLVWNDGSLVQVSGDQEGLTPEDVASETPNNDINGDGIIDLHVRRAAPGQPVDISFADMLWIDRYLQWNGAGKFEIVEERYEDGDKGFSVRIPAGWKGHYTVRRPTDPDAGAIAFDYYDTASNRRAELFRIRTVAAGEWKDAEEDQQDRSDRYAVLAKASGLVYEAIWDEPPADWPEEAAAAFKQMQPGEAALRQQFALLPET
ncbi:FG-GAP repeat domain-containing protein [Paenibacillus humicola]|uniref:FG-GAP repeat domain-containing protein n=1 Tax=Paenibacillus humicola TaxID=3110540 RepID=UPI00237AD6FD|nr:VCBS repeat-containing protein [Paenibacillus humicola]